MTTLLSAAKHYRLSALIARRAVQEARRVRKSGGVTAVATVVATHQMASASIAEPGIGSMLAEQAIKAAPSARLNIPAFTTGLANFAPMVERIGTDLEFDRLVESLVQDAGRAAESVATAVRPDVAHVRYLSPPSCSRCAVLAGRVYRYSDGFKRHPNCDCVMVPTTEAKAQPVDVGDLIRSGMVTGLSKRDIEALNDGADLNQIVNVRRTAAGLRESGRVLARAGRLAPEGIYRLATDRDQAVELLRRNGYIL